MSDYDAIVIGAGQAGPGVAGAIAGRGKRVALIEMEQLGGTCLNHGCKPTKALRATATTAHLARRAAEYGVQTGEVRVDFGAAMHRVHVMIDSMRQSVIDWVDGEDNIDLLHGQARLHTGAGTLHPGERTRHRVDVGEQSLTAPEIYLDLGARALVPAIEGLDTVSYLTEVGLLELEELPKHLVVVGGGYIGLEFGQMFRRFGADVTIVAGGGVAAREDDDVSAIIAAMLTDEGVKIVEGRTVRARADGRGGTYRVSVELDTGATVSGSHLLVATGRAANSDLIGHDHNLEMDERGFFTINDRFETSAPGVWALGDVNGHGAFTHTAYQDGQIVMDPSRNVAGRVTAYAMFTDPPLGRVGMSVKEARESDRRVLKAELGMSAVSRAVLESETTGLMRILVDADTEEFLGATFLGLHGDDLVQVISTAMQAGVRYPAVRDQLPIHPTMAEFIPFVLQSLEPLESAAE